MTSTRRRITLAVAATAMTVGLSAGTAGSASACVILPTGSSSSLSGLITALLGGGKTTPTKTTPTKTTPSSTSTSTKSSSSATKTSATTTSSGTVSAT